MRVTKRQLRRIIREELKRELITEGEGTAMMNFQDHPYVVVTTPDGKRFSVSDMHEELMLSTAPIEYEGEMVDFSPESAFAEYLRSEQYVEDHPMSIAEMFLISRGYDPDDPSSVTQVSPERPY
jgi:hypothetical protein